ncbi:TraB/GumN family protein [Fulvivirga sedimenti]|uniref:TraB/GumN family protein n=1 Tax=Fulvivirga sedimenti TaxID=2879465 RepID=A0A9X1HQX3_9BACT|nr:TraB/GumN family protein [Fulvivirga sedimenti]MCA6075516.1 TraB/GumN family protein [Fulvivirga sedimenti]MCA6076693.1 TraB/GumN family protein [Fulvivirga sedimenti]MCA6077821.1 TraB/GumN family protein [Fulvivirga sedimenti]
MKRRIIFSILLAFAGSVLHAQETSLLWKITGKDIKDSYLFGTIHLLCQDDFYLPETVKQSLATSEQLVLELDFDDPNMYADIQKYIMLEDDQSLADMLTEEEMIAFKSFFTERMGMPADNLVKIKPFMLMSMIMPVVLECPPASYEQTLVGLAKENEQEVIGLETVEEQMDAIDSFSQDEMADMLMEYIVDIDDMKADFGQMVAAYKKQDPELLLEFMNEQVAESGMEDFNEIMLVNRNKRWIDRIPAIASEKSTFFAVGAGHLGGEEGVIKLLRKAGYTVTPITE